MKFFTHLLFITLYFGLTFTGHSQSTTITLQPDSDSGKDAHLSSKNNTTNYSNSSALRARAWTSSGQSTKARGLIDFDLSSIPSNAIITDAKLTLTPYISGSSNPLIGQNRMVIKRITQNWEEQSVTWNNQPSTDQDFQVIIGPSSSTSTYSNINVKNLIVNRFNHPNQNYGLHIKLANEHQYRAAAFASSDHPNPGMRPKLEISYTINNQITKLESQYCGLIDAEAYQILKFNDIPQATSYEIIANIDSVGIDTIFTNSTEFKLTDFPNYGFKEGTNYNIKIRKTGGTFGNICQVGTSGTLGNYTGEYQWFTEASKDFWGWKVLGDGAGPNNSWAANGEWKDDFYLTSKIEVVSFPFMPDYNNSSATSRYLRLPNASEWNDNDQAWAPYNSSPVMKKSTEYLVGSSRSVAQGGSASSGNTFNLNVPSTLISAQFENTKANAINTLNSHATSGNTRIEYPHAVLKHTIYLNCKNSNAKLDSLSFIVDNTRRLLYYPYTIDNFTGQGGLADNAHDVEIWSNFVTSNERQTSGAGPVSDMYCYNPCADFSQDMINYSQTLNSSISTFNNNIQTINASFNALNYYPKLPLKDQANACGETYHSPSVYPVGNPVCELRPDGTCADYYHPLPYSLNMTPGNYNNNGYTINNVFYGMKNNYVINENIDLTSYNTSEKIIYNPIEANITASNLIFPSGYEFRTVLGNAPGQHNFPTPGEVTNSDPTNFYYDQRDIPVESRLNSAPGVYDGSKYYIKNGATLTIQNCVGLYDTQIIVEAGGTLNYNSTKIFGRYLITNSGGTINSNNNSGACDKNDAYCKNFFLQEKIVYPVGSFHAFNNQSYTVAKQIIIENGAIVQYNNCTIKFGDIETGGGSNHNGFIVEPGGKLILNNSTVEGIENCTQFDGINVLGDPSQPVNPNLSIIPHAILQMNNESTIKNAKIGIHSINGGIVDAKNSFFTNNIISIKVSDKDDAFVIATKNSFKINSDFPKENSSDPDLRAFIELDNGKAIIRGNTFENLNTNYTDEVHYGTGILSYNSSLRVNQYISGSVNVTPVSNAFKNLYKGVDTYSGYSLSINNIIENNNFLNITKSITLNGGSYDDIKNNTITIAAPRGGGFSSITDGYGIYLLNAGASIVESNTITGYSGGIGIVMRNTQASLILPQTNDGATGNIYKNTVTETFVAVQMEGSHSKTLLNCNDFSSNNSNGYRLTNASVPFNNNIYTVVGIQGAIGSCVPTVSNSPQWDYPAGNEFTTCAGSINQIVNLSTSTAVLFYKDALGSSNAPQSTCTTPISTNIGNCSSSIDINPCLSLSTYPVHHRSSNQSSNLEISENELSSAHLQMGELRSHIRNENYDVIINHLEKFNDQKTIELRMLLAIENNNIATFKSEFDKIVKDSTVESIQFNLLYHIILDIFEANKTIKEISQGQKNRIEKIAKSNSSIALAAKSILAQLENKQIIQSPENPNIRTDHYATESTNSSALVNIHPNPSSNGLFSLEISSLMANQKTIEVIDEKGNLILEITISTGKTVIDLSSHSKGLYFIKITDDFHQETHKVIYQ